MRHILQAATASLLLAFASNANAASVFNFLSYNLTRVMPNSYEDASISHELLDQSLTQTIAAPDVTIHQFAKTSTDVVKASAEISMPYDAAGRVTSVAAQSVSTYTTRVTPSATSSFTVNAYFHALTSVIDPYSLSTRGQAFDPDDEQWADIAVGDSRPFYSVLSRISFNFGLFDLFSGEFQTFDITQSVERSLDVLNDNGTLTLTTKPGSSQGYFSDRRKSYCSGINYDCTIVSDDTGSQSIAGSNFNQSFDANVLEGREYILSLSMSCLTAASTEQGNLGGFSTECAGDHSGYWNGLTNISASNFSLIGETGQNYVFSSPDSPQPLVSNVPEPAQWALLITGFGLVGGVARRRRLAIA